MGELALPIRSPPEPAFAGRLWSDERLARRVASGDSRAFALLYRRHHQALYRYCRAILRDEHDAQDALQSAMTRAFGALRAQERDLAVKPWLFRIAHNEAVTVLRRRQPAAALTEIAEPAGAGVEDALERRERLATLVADLQALSERHRAALVMRELSDLSIEEIAGALSTSPGAAKQALFEARTALHDFAEGRAMECERIRRAISDEDRRALRGRRLQAHLRACSGCRDFQTAMATRHGELHALAPALAPLAATTMLSGLLAGGPSGHAGGLAVGSGGLAAGSGGLAAGSGTAAGGSAVASVATKVAVCVAVAATAASGARLALVHNRPGHTPASSDARPAPRAPDNGGRVHAYAVQAERAQDLANSRAGGRTTAASGGKGAVIRGGRRFNGHRFDNHRLTSGASGLRASGEARGGHHAGGQAHGISAPRHGQSAAGGRALRGAASHSPGNRGLHSGRGGSKGHHGRSSQTARGGRAKPGTSSRQPSDVAGHSQRYKQAHPAAPQTAPTAAGTPAQGQRGGPGSPRAGAEAEGRGGARNNSRS